MDPKVFLSIKEVAQRSGLSRSFLYRAVESGSMPCYRPSRRRVLVRWTEFEEWLAQFRSVGTVNRQRGRPRSGGGSTGPFLFKVPAEEVG